MIYAALALAVAVLALLWYTRKAGQDSVRADVEKADADAGARVGQAEADGPRSKSDVLERLRDPKRVL